LSSVLGECPANWKRFGNPCYYLNNNSSTFQDVEVIYKKKPITVVLLMTGYTTVYSPRDVCVGLSLITCLDQGWAMLYKSKSGFYDLKEID
jgi:hypothetical protein